MIDVHCHLEQPDYDKDRDDVIKSCMNELKAVISSSPYLPHFRQAVELHKKYSNFVFISLGLHPIYIKELNEGIVKEAAAFISDNKERIVAIGEIGLDYYWVKEDEWHLRQQELFRDMIRLSKRLKLPLVIHTRETDKTIEILEQEQAKNVMMHLFELREHLKRVIDNGWSISLGPNISNSKTRQKIARDMPLERIMLETDSPWFGFGKRNTPLSIKQVAEKIAEIKKLKFEEVWRQCGINAINLFNLPIKKSSFEGF
jgi:TatD DNase family protein